MLNGKLLEKPEVRIGPSGVSRVDPAEILRSRAGQAEISKAAAVAVVLKLRPAVSQASRA